MHLFAIQDIKSIGIIDICTVKVEVNLNDNCNTFITERLGYVEYHELVSNIEMTGMLHNSGIYNFFPLQVKNDINI